MFLKQRVDCRELAYTKAQKFPPLPPPSFPLSPPTSLLSWIKFLDGRTGACSTSSLHFRKSGSTGIAIQGRREERKEEARQFLGIKICRDCIIVTSVPLSWV